MDDGSPVFANVEIKGRMVTLAVNSAGRAAEGRAELAAHLGNLVGTPLTEIRTLEQMLADEATQRPVLDEPEIPPEDMERIVHAMLTREYRSEEHTSELQSLMRISYAVFCLKKKKNESDVTLLTLEYATCKNSVHNATIVRLL